MKNQYKALQAIERLVGGSFGLDMEWLLVEKQRGKEIDEKLLKAAEVITDIYMISHAENSPCNHTDWQEKKYKILKFPEE